MNLDIEMKKCKVRREKSKPYTKTIGLTCDSRRKSPDKSVKILKTSSKYNTIVDDSFKSHSMLNNMNGIRSENGSYYPIKTNTI